MAEDFIVLDLREPNGRFFARPKLPTRVYEGLLLLAAAEGITFEELLHRAIEEYAQAVLHE